MCMHFNIFVGFLAEKKLLSKRLFEFPWKQRMNRCDVRCDKPHLLLDSHSLYKGPLHIRSF